MQRAVSRSRVTVPRFTARKDKNLCSSRLNIETQRLQTHQRQHCDANDIASFEFLRGGTTH